MTTPTTPPMPEGFTDCTAWMAIHWKFSPFGTSYLDQVVIDWQKDNQERVKAAIRADLLQLREAMQIAGPGDNPVQVPGPAMCVAPGDAREEAA